MRQIQSRDGSDSVTLRVRHSDATGQFQSRDRSDLLTCLVSQEFRPRDRINPYFACSATPIGGDWFHSTLNAETTSLHSVHCHALRSKGRHSVSKARTRFHRPALGSTGLHLLPQACTTFHRIALGSTGLHSVQTFCTSFHRRVLGSTGRYLAAVSAETSSLASWLTLSPAFFIRHSVHQSRGMAPCHR